MDAKILAFAGSLRKDSWNKRLVKIAASGARTAGAEVTLVGLEEFPMPPFNGDIEDATGLPESAERLKELMKSHHGFLISTPEYNSSLPGSFKNILDWVSRPSNDGEAPLIAYRGKSALVMSASPGAYGGIQSLGALRLMLLNLGVNVLPDRLALPKANAAFDEAGNLTDPKQQKAVEELGAKLFRALAGSAQPGGSR